MPAVMAYGFGLTIKFTRQISFNQHQYFFPLNLRKGEEGNSTAHKATP